MRVHVLYLVLVYACLICCGAWPLHHSVSLSIHSSKPLYIEWQNFSSTRIVFPTKKRPRRKDIRPVGVDWADKVAPTRLGKMRVIDSQPDLLFNTESEVKIPCCVF